MSALTERAVLQERADASAGFFGANADRVTRLCEQMAGRFQDGGRLLAFGLSAEARSDVRHVAVEFVHPVIVGKRALPALGLGDPDELALIAESGDIVMAFGEPDDDPRLGAAVAAARDRGCLTVAFSALGAEWTFEPPTVDRFIRQELVETTYHVLWELVHVFFEHRGRHRETAGASSFLYPFLDGGEGDNAAVLADVRESVLMKADEVERLRSRTVLECSAQLADAARALRACVDRGGRVLALGNGGSATDAMDIVADLIRAGHPAIDLTADSAIVTAIANDIGPEAIFARQLIAYGRPGDLVIALSTSGSSLSVIEALAQTRRQRLASVAFVGYDGGRIATERLADQVVVAPSQHIPRIQEAQATAYHVLIESVGGGGSVHTQGGPSPADAPTQEGARR